MVRVGKRRREGIVEHRRSFVEIDPMLLEVGSGFPGIPFENHNVSIRCYACLPRDNLARAPLATACESTPRFHDHAGWLSRYGAHASATRRTAMAVFFGRTTIVSSAADTVSSED